MKKTILFFIAIFFFISIKCFSQCNWFPINNTGLSSDFNAVYFPSQWSRVLVGANGLILKTENEGYSWTQPTSNTAVNLNCVFFPTDSIGFAAGDNGTILKSINRGDVWTTLTSPIMQTKLNGMYFTSKNNGFIVGQGENILKTADGGFTWNIVHSGNFELMSVYFYNQNLGWAVGSLGTILRTTDAGVTWNFQTGTHTGINYSVNFIDSLTGYIAGQTGIIQKTINGGTTWSNVITNIQTDLHSIAFHDNEYGYAVGINGTILSTTDGGVTWSLNNSGILDDLKSVFIKYDTKNITGTNGILLQYAQDIVLSQPSDQSACTGNFYLSMSIGFVSQQIQYTGQWQMDFGSGWNNISINDTSHYYSTSANMEIHHYNLGFNNRKYRFIYNTFCGTDTSDIATIHIRAPLAGNILNLLPEYCAADTAFLLNGFPVQGYFDGQGISDNHFNPSDAQGDSVIIIYYYTDSTGCQSQVSGTTQIFKTPIINMDSLLKPNCGLANGSIIISVFDGIPPYQYHWANGSSSNILSNVQAGIYHITVTDSHGCKSSDFEILANINEPAFDAYSTDASCILTCDGVVNIFVFQGIPPYTYSWSNGQTGESDSALCKGHYFISVTDSLGCKSFSDVTIGYVLEAAIINGYTFSQTGPVFGNIVVHLFKDSLETIVEEKNITISYGSEGMFTISEIPDGNYYLQVEPDHDANPSLATTFFKMNGSSYIWDSSMVIPLNCGSNQYCSIQMVSLFDNGTGSGFISGYIHQPVGGFSNNGKGIYMSSYAKLAGEPVPGAEIYVELEPDDEPIVNTQTDSSGYYEVSGLADGEYSMNVQIPGVPMDSTYIISISGTDTAFTNINFFVDTSGQAIIDTLNYSIGEIGKDIASISIYPNPFNESLNFEIEITNGSDVKIEIFDLAGKNIGTVINEKKPKGKHIIKLNAGNIEISKGAYFLRCKVNNNYFIKKLIKM